MQTRLPHSAWALMALLLLWIGPEGPRQHAAAQGTTFGYTGYVKNLGIRSSSFLTQDSYLLDVSRVRTQGLLDVGSVLHAELWLDTELFLGSFLSTQEFALSQAVEPTTFFDLDWTVGEGDRYYVRQALFRAFATAYLGDVQVTVGRQRIAWGTGFAWNPTDLLNPFNPSAIELDEKEGIDAAHVAVSFGAFSRFEGVVVPGRRRDRMSTALRMGTHLKEYDVAVMGGFFREDWVLGGDFAGYVKNAGFRGEVAYTWAEAGPNHVRAVLNADYNFPGGYYVFIELYHNGQGVRDADAYDYGALLSGTTFNVAREYLAASVAKAITPLMGFGLYSLANLNDQSSLVGPSFTYSLAANLEVSASAYFFLGSDTSEFGRLRHAYFGAIQFYF